MAEHERLGVLSYSWPRMWPVFLEESRRARDAVDAVHAKVAQEQPSANGIRMINADTMEPLYVAHVEMVLLAVLTLRHFVLEVERTVGLSAKKHDDDLGRFRAACNSAGIEDPANDDRWSIVGELVRMRHVIEHPTQQTVYSTNQWDQVPLAWSLTDAALRSFDAFDEIFCNVADAWEVRRQELATAGTLTIERGQRANRPAKNPPTDSRS